MFKGYLDNALNNIFCCWLTAKWLGREGTIAGPFQLNYSLLLFATHTVRAFEHGVHDGVYKPIFKNVVLH